MSRSQVRSDDFLRPFSDQQFTRHILVTVRFAWNLNRGGTKKMTRYQVLYLVENPPKVNRTVPYHAVEKRH